MTTLHFSITIDAPRERVWECLWSDEGYRTWTAAFSAGSYAESDWEQGSRVVFLTPSGEGMFGIIERKVEFEIMRFKHIGEIINGVEERKEWEGAIEEYLLSESNGKTVLQVNMDTSEDYVSMFQGVFPKALNILKEESEKRTAP
ncbi:SRPBCC domain-containing protein [Segetibacter sp. 3557_3]|uniref:SRPBCC family protein n=1 Tax=Segetibacter sp. 3557_3 TaxID=2547429 RepID=UPI00105899E9|nr:SRPBCC domain-containing protein [Segetibacter sp. 3557_3]TDH28605.1 SRPBCC domain-containing protein [Segetibacter sp. 3557_3]